VRKLCKSRAYFGHQIRSFCALDITGASAERQSNQQSLLLADNSAQETLRRASATCRGIQGAGPGMQTLRPMESTDSRGLNALLASRRGRCAELLQHGEAFKV